MRRRDSPSGIAFQRRPAHRRAGDVLRRRRRDFNATAYPLLGAQDELHGVVTVFWPPSELNGDT
jgi:hypothetical protein